MSRLNDSTRWMRLLSGFAAVLIAAFALVPVGSRSASADNASDAVDTVSAYYSAIDAYDYKDAYDLFGSVWQKGQSLDNFTKGFGDTAFVELTTGDTTAQSDGTTGVKVTLTSWHNDGKIVGYAGTYFVGSEGGQLRILNASIKQVAVPKTTPALCSNADLAFSLGPWDAATGSRYSSLLAENTSDATCVAGGAPRLIITDTTTHKVYKSTGEPGNFPLAMVLKPGDQAAAPIRLGNFCGIGTNDSFSVQAEMPADDSVATVDASGGLSIPPCLGEGQPALVSTKGFQAPGG